MRLLVTGATGQVGWELTRSLTPLGEIITVDRTRCDLSRPETIAPLVREVRPDVIVNAAAYTAVDRAESEEALATTVNGTAVGVLAEQARQCGALLVHYSTDYVFDGRKSEPYVEEDAPNPINAYGRSKLAGEIAIRDTGCDHLILRTTWVYAARGQNFVRTILHLAREREELNIVADQFGAPTSARFVADATTQVLRQVYRERRNKTFLSGIFHVTNSDATTWHGFAEEIVRAAAMHGLLVPDSIPAINPIATQAYPLPAARPANSLLDCQRLQGRYGVDIVGWRQSMKTVMLELAASSRTI